MKTTQEKEKDLTNQCTKLESDNRNIDDMSAITLSDQNCENFRSNENSAEKNLTEASKLADCGTNQCCSNEHVCNESGICSCPKVEYETDNFVLNDKDLNEDFSESNLDVPFSNATLIDDDLAESYGNKLAILEGDGLVPTTCLNLEPDTPWDVLNCNVSDDGTCVPFSNGGVNMTDFSTSDIIIENPDAEGDNCYNNENSEVCCEHINQEYEKMFELNLESLGQHSTEQCKCCPTNRNRFDDLGCSCRRTTRIVIDKNCGISSVLILHGEKDDQDQNESSNCDSNDGSEIYANTLFIDMDEVGVLNEGEGPYILPHEKSFDLTDDMNTDQPDIDEVPEDPETEVDSNKHHTVYVCDEEDLQDVCRICHCGSEDEPLISPCQCTGSMQYIHHSCLMTWLQRTVRQNCELCQQDIPVVRRRKPITQWGLPNSRPTCFLWLLAFIVTLTLNIASITRDASQRCTTNACIVFYIVEAIGAILGFMFSCFFTVRSIRFIKVWMIHNEEWTFDVLSNTDNTRTVKPQKPSKKRPNIQI